MAKNVNMSFRVDVGLREGFKKLCHALGTTSSTALNMFMADAVREQRLPGYRLVRPADDAPESGD